MRRTARIAVPVGIVVAVLGLSLLHATAVAVPPYPFFNTYRMSWATAYTMLLCLTAYGAGIPDLTGGRRSTMVTSIAAAASAGLGISTIQLFLGTALLPRFVIFLGAALLVPWYALCTLLAEDGRELEESRDRVLVVGHWSIVEELRGELDHLAERSAHIVGSLSGSEARSRGLRRPVVEYVDANAISVVVLDREAQDDPNIVGQVADLHEAGTRVRTLSLFYEEWLGKLPVKELERVSLMFDIGEIHRRRYGRQRRVLDLLLALAGMLVLVPAVPLVALGNLVANRGPLFYRQDRVGQGGRLFRIVKFRTMRVAEDGTALNEWTRDDDPRITPFGRLLRRSHLDELPQVLNVLKGDVAFVGPRPEQPHYVAELAEKLPFYSLRHLAMPGITGWAQVKFGYAGDQRAALEKLQYDFYYLRHQGLGFDIRILARTTRSILRSTGT